MQFIYKLPKTVWDYLALNQPLFLRGLHGVIALLVIGQLLNSNGMALTSTHQLTSAALPRFFTVLHFSMGLVLLVLSVVLIGYCVQRRGVRYFYPYLWGDWVQLKQDMRILFRGELPPAEPKGLATCVQGLGLGALSLVVLSGASWFVLWQLDSSFAEMVKRWHETLTGLMEVYIIAHGGMGLVHIALWGWQRRMQ